MSSAHDEGADRPARSTDDGALATSDAAPTTAPADVRLTAGQTVAGRYTVEGRIGAGSIGRSYLAKAPDGAQVVIKLPHAALREDPQFMRHFRRDQDAVQKLEHPHVARVLEHGDDDVVGPFVCREFLDGDDLVSAIARGVQTPRRLCELFMQLLTALADAHRNGVLHGNLKPSNVWVLRDAEGGETVKVCDFGAPRRPREGVEYMAPEQARGGPVDGQADVYATGVMLFEALTGELPFRGATPQETLSLHRTESVPLPHERKPDLPIPRELEAVCVKALAKVPGERHRSPREMSQALRAVVSLLGARANEPLGSSAFMDASAAHAGERLTMPGEALRSRHKFWLGAFLLVLVCVAVLLTPEVRDELQPTRTPEQQAQLKERGEEALQRGSTRLIAGDHEGALTDLRNARRALGDTPEVLRALGEALLTSGGEVDRAEGVALLSRYLDMTPEAEDRAFVERLLRHAKADR